MKQSGIARRLLLWFLILGLLPMTVLAAVVYNESRQALIKAQKEKLRAIADYNTNRLERWARERMRSVTNLARLTASMSALKTFTETFDSAPRGEEYAQSGAYQQAKEARADIINHLDFIAYQYKYQNIYFISMKGDIVAAVKPHPALGTNLQDGPYGDTELAKVFRRLSQKTWPAESKDAWIEGEISDFRPFGPSAPDRSAFVVAPVRDCANNSECNAPYGFLAVQMPHTAIAQAALDNIGMSSPNDDSAGRAYSGLGRTGEVIIGSREGNRIVFVAAMRHDQRAAFERYINVGDESMKGLQEVLGKGSGTGELVAGDESVKNLEGDEGKRDKETWAGEMIDYDGTRTIAAWNFVRAPRWGVVVKMAESEVLAPADAQLRSLLWLGGGMMALIVLLALFVARSIYGPIGRLTRAVRALPSGDLRRRHVPTEGDDEVAELSRALNGALDEVWLLQYISHAANEARGVEPALQTALEEVCRHAGMPVGHVYEADREQGGELVSTSIWHLPEPDRFANFRRVTEGLRLKPGEGLPGRVLQSGQPEWAEDVTKEDGSHPQALAAGGVEVRGGFALPVLVGREVSAVLEFLTDRPAPPNPSLLRTAKTIGTLLGRAIERKREDKLLKEKAAAEAANQAKSAFLASVSHDLRTPLNAILGYSEMHYEGIDGNAQPEGGGEATGDGDGGARWEEEKRVIISDLRKINNSGKHLLKIINNVLDLSRIEAGKMTVDAETFDVAALVREVADMDEPLVRHNGNRLEVDCPDSVGTMHADKMMVRRILSNLLGNAAKFTKQGVVRLAVERQAEPDAEWIIFRVSDTGIGMTREQLGRIFESFTQAEKSIKSRYGGTGLGLTISKNFSQIMGGDIEGESEPGRGTTFTVRLPAGVYAPRGEDVVNTSDLMRPPEGATVVLVIDDDPAMRELTKHFLGKEGFHVEAAASGEDGIRLARKLRPDVITLDVVMPGMDGYGVVSALRADEELRDIPVVMLTIVDEKTRGFPLGVAEYMTKPINWEHLTAVINKYRREPETACTVLVVEDDATTRELLRRTLERDGWEVETAENGRVGLERVEQHRPDLILLDLTMPEMDGFEFVKALRHDPRWTTIPVAIITARDLTFEDRLRLSGCVEKFLDKGSYTREELLREVRDLVSACARRLPVAETTETATRN